MDGDNTYPLRLQVLLVPFRNLGGNQITNMAKDAFSKLTFLKHL